MAAKSAKKPPAKPAPLFVKISSTGKPLKPGAKTWAAFGVVGYRDRQGHGLMFMAKDLGRHAWEIAKEVIAASILLGKSDWFMPDDMQGQLFLDRSRPYPRCYTEFYKGETGLMWVDKPVASYSVDAWYVSLDGGGVYIGDRLYGGLAVGCRRVPPSQCSALGI
jgi:hypothetical protein